MHYERFINKYVGPPYCRAEMYAGRFTIFRTRITMGIPDGDISVWWSVQRFSMRGQQQYMADGQIARRQRSCIQCCAANDHSTIDILSLTSRSPAQSSEILYRLLPESHYACMLRSKVKILVFSATQCVSQKKRESWLLIVTFGKQRPISKMFSL